MASRPNILLLVADTQRAQNMHCYGYENETTPTWDAVADEGLLCEQNTSAGIWSLPGYSSMFTGTHVCTHRADGDHEYVNQGLAQLPEVLSQAGYETCGLMPNTWGSSVVGLGRGFEIYRDPAASAGDPPIQRDELGRAEARIEAIGRWLDERDDSRPFFFFTIFSEPHATYHPPQKYIDQFMPDDVTEDELQSVMERQNVIAMAAEDVVMSEREWEILLALSDGEVRACDDRMAAALQQLRDRDLLDDTLVILTSDHGDVMGQRPPWWGHLGEICDTLIHVPLILRHPDLFEPGSRIEGVTQTHDIFATCCEVAGAEPPTPAREQSRSLIEPARGENLRPFALSEHFTPVQLFERILRDFPRFDVRRYNVSFKSWRSAAEKYVWRSDGRDEYYDVQADPFNVRNLIEDNETRAAELRDMMTEFLLSLDTHEFGDLQSVWPGKAAWPEIAAKLQALGLYRKVLDWPDWAPR